MIHDMIHQASYMAHGYCLLWKPWLVGLHAGSDLLISAAYFAIPVAIWIFVSKRPNIELRGLAFMFAAFILWCGFTHVFNFITLWNPIYELQGWVKAITATISAATAVAIFPLIPRALAIPSPKELQIANDRLSAEIMAHRQTLQELERARAELEERVSERTRELNELSERFRLLFERAPVAMLTTDHEGRIKQANAAATGLLGYAADELVNEFVERVLPERIRQLHLGLRKEYLTRPEARPMGAGRDLYARQKNGKEFPVEIGLNPMEVKGQTLVVASVVDITERRQREDQIKLLMREVNHRSKNMLGVVQSIARQTAGKNHKDFVERFSERLRALGASQDLLISTDWRGAELADLIKAQLAHFGDLIGHRIMVEGPPVRLNAAAAQTIGMALHELATNASKYGALSNAAGTIDIAWQMGGTSGPPRFTLSWKEQGGPPVMAPIYRGFGMTVIGPMANLALGATVKLDFPQDGLRWQIDCPAQKVTEIDTHTTDKPEGIL